jgi:hypothetical protein
MGSSSSYKGSKSSSWKIARELFATDATEQPATPDGNTPTAPVMNPAAQTAAAIAQGLITDNPVASGARHNFSLGGLLGGVGGGGGGASTRRTRSTGAGKRSHHHAQQGAARASIAIRAAYSLRSGDAQRLQEVGLDLARLQTLNPTQQCAMIAEVVIGDANTPDDAALKRATIEHLKDILLAEQPMSMEDTIRNFIADWVFQLGLIELKAANNELQLTATQLTTKERQIKNWLRVKARSIPVEGLETLSARKLANATARLVDQTLELVRADSR